MLKSVLLLTSLLFVTLVSLHASNANDHLSQHQRVILGSNLPSPIEYRFSFDLPAGSQFMEVEKVLHREAWSCDFLEMCC